MSIQQVSFLVLLRLEAYIPQNPLKGTIIVEWQAIHPIMVYTCDVISMTRNEFGQIVTKITLHGRSCDIPVYDK